MSFLFHGSLFFLIAFFIFASSIKLAGWHRFIFETQLAFFHKYGLNRKIMALVGIVELIAAVALMLGYIDAFDWGARSFGSLLILSTSVGALFFHFRFDTWKDAIPAIITGTLSALILSVTWFTL